MPDYHSPPWTMPVGHPGVSDDWNQYVRDNTPYIWDFPSYELKQDLNATDMLQGQFVIPADAMGVHRHLEIWAHGYLKNGTSGAQAAPAWSLMFETTPLLDSGLGANMAVQASRLGNYILCVRIQQTNAVDAQEVSIVGTYFDGSDATDFATGTGIYRNFNSPKGGLIQGYASTAVDFSPGGTLALKARCAVSSAQYLVGLLAAKAWIL